MRVGGDLAEHRDPARKAVDVLHREIDAPASWATASRCSTVLVEPPMAMSNDMAFSKAAFVAIERGSTARRPRRIVTFGIADDERRSVLEQPAAVDVRGDDRAVARQRDPAPRSDSSSSWP